MSELDGVYIFIFIIGICGLLMRWISDIERRMQKLEKPAPGTQDKEDEHGA